MIIFFFFFFFKTFEYFDKFFLLTLNGIIFFKCNTIVVKDGVKLYKKLEIIKEYWKN
jgi:hypothetical protein